MMHSVLKTSSSSPKSSKRTSIAMNVFQKLENFAAFKYDAEKSRKLDLRHEIPQIVPTSLSTFSKIRRYSLVTMDISSDSPILKVNSTKLMTGCH